jgi:hypothetical protein
MFANHLLHPIFQMEFFDLEALHDLIFILRRRRTVADLEESPLATLVLLVQTAKRLVSFEEILSGLLTLTSVSAKTTVTDRSEPLAETRGARRGVDGDRDRSRIEATSG